MGDAVRQEIVMLLEFKVDHIKQEADSFRVDLAIQEVFKRSSGRAF
jgi:hypothetical protein